MTDIEIMSATIFNTIRWVANAVGIQQYKMVLVVRSDLKMTSGKIAAQCAHAAIASYKELKLNKSKDLDRWEMQGQAKVVLRCQDENELTQLQTEASNIGIFSCVVCDAGRTQVKSGTSTVLVVGPGPVSMVDQVTGHLKLL